MADQINVVSISIFDLDTHIANGCTTIGVFTCPSLSGTYTELTTVGVDRIELDPTNEYYEYYHTIDDPSIYTYRVKLFTGTSSTDFLTKGFYGNTSDLTQELRYEIEDINIPYRYTIKELKRFIRKAVNTLQMTTYRYRFSADKDGIISPTISNEDKGIIILQAHMEVLRSQMIKAADTSISWKDGRGSFNNRTHESLVDQLKLMKAERNELIKNSNDIRIVPARINKNPSIFVSSSLGIYGSY